jgi:hypothetical protein
MPFEPSDRPNTLELWIFEQHAAPNESAHWPNDLTDAPDVTAHRPNWLADTSNEPEDWPDGLAHRPNLSFSLKDFGSINVILPAVAKIRRHGFKAAVRCEPFLKIEI